MGIAFFSVQLNTDNFNSVIKSNELICDLDNIPFINDSMQLIHAKALILSIDVRLQNVVEVFELMVGVVRNDRIRKGETDQDGVDYSLAKYLILELSFFILSEQDG